MAFINQMEPWVGEEEKQAIMEYLGLGGWLTEFAKTHKFEHMICDYTGAKYCVAVNNGTVGLTLAALACGLGLGDEVIVPNYTMIATPNSVRLFGAVPVFVDIEPETLCLDIELVKRTITSSTKAIMLVSANGRYPKSGIKSFITLSKERGLILIEDSAQSLGSFYPDGRHMGTVGKAGIFSFSAPKVITTGQGGAIVTNDHEIARKLRELKDFGRTSAGCDVHDTIGWNFKFTDLQAVVGIEQMRKLEWRVERKKEILKLYQRLLKDTGQVEFFEQDLICTTPWFIDALVECRTGLMEYLADNDIGTRAMYPPINKQKAYNMPGEYGISNIVGAKGLWFPSSSRLSDEQIHHICDKIKEYYGEH